MLPITAMPRAAPSSRDASFMAEPAPARRAGTADMIAAVIGDMARAMPDTSGMMLTSTYQYGVESSRPRNSSIPTPTEHMPAATVRLAPNRALSRGVSGATTIMIGAIGSSRSAEPSGL